MEATPAACGQALQPQQHPGAGSTLPDMQQQQQQPPLQPVGLTPPGGSTPVTGFAVQGFAMPPPASASGSDVLSSGGAAPLAPGGPSGEVLQVGSWCAAS